MILSILVMRLRHLRYLVNFNVSGAMLDQVDLSETNLSKAKLTGANLHRIFLLHRFRSTKLLISTLAIP